MSWYENADAMRYVGVFHEQDELDLTIRAARAHGWVVADTSPTPCADAATHVIVFHDGDRFDGVPKPSGYLVTFVRTAPTRYAAGRAIGL
jgi:hypothetical protein